jgi:Peptidase family M1 domain
MRRLTVALIVVALNALPAANAVQDRPPQADGVVRLLSDLEAALISGAPADFEAIAAASLPASDRDRFRHAAEHGQVLGAAVRERGRRPVGGGFEVLAEVLVNYGRNGRLATWQITAEPRAGSPEVFELTGLREIASVEGLLKLRLDPSRQFSLRNFTFQGPDFTLSMSSGSAFVAESDAGVTAIALRGKGTVAFTPDDPAEQSQVKIFAGRTHYETDVDQVFIRVNAAELASLARMQGLVPAARVDPKELQRAQQLFEDKAPRTFNLDLRDLAQESWSLEPSFGSVVVEFRSRKHGWLTYARAPSEPEDISLFDRARNHVISSYTSAERLAERGRFYSEDAGAAYDMLRYGIEARFDPERLWISGHGTFRLRIREKPVSTLTFRLAAPLTISSVTSPSFGRLLALRIVGQSSFIVTLPAPAKPGAELVFDVAYSGRLEPQRLDREAIDVDRDAQLTQDLQLPQDVVLIQPEPRFMYSNRSYWYPQAEVTDYATAAVRLSVPSEYQIVASGTLLGSTLDAEQEEGSGETKYVRTVDYGADRPVRYLACVISRFVPIGRTAVPVPAIGPIMSSDGSTPPASGADNAGNSVNVEVVSTPRMTGRNRQMIPQIADMIAFYAKTLGGAPYPDFTLAGLDDNLPGGHSPPFFAILHEPLPTTPYSWTSDPVSFGDTYPPFFLAHEIAHQWWGQAVGWKNYHEQWLSEGLAQYFAVLYAASDRGPDAARNLLGQMRSSAMTMSSRGPIWLGYRLGHLQNDSRIFRAIVYNKSAVVLHMLRMLIGDDAFFDGLRRFYATWLFRKAGTDDLRAAFEAGTPVRLGRFFDRWILGSSLPRLRVGTHIDEDRNVAVLHVQQLTDEVFDLPLVISIQYDDGRSEEVTIAVTAAESDQTIPLKGRVRRIEPKDEFLLGTLVK